ncbi:MAG: SGNH hydrolase domain-containing protein [Actinomycetota bacterium]
MNTEGFGSMINQISRGISTAVAVTLLSTPFLAGATALENSPIGSNSALQNLMTTASTTVALPKDLQPQLSSAQYDLFERLDRLKKGCLVDFHSTTATGSRPSDETCTFGDRQAKKLVVLYGDAHAAMWLPALDILGAKQHFRVLVVTRASCLIASIGVWNWAAKGPSPACRQFGGWAIRHINQLHPSTVIISDASNGYQRDPQHRIISQHRYAAAMTETFKKLHAPERALIFIGRTPQLPSKGPECLAAHPSSVLSCGVTVSAYKGTLSRFEESSALAGGAKFVSSEKWLCSLTFCPAVVGNTVVYVDNQQVSRTFSRALSTIIGQDLGSSTF